MVSDHAALTVSVVVPTYRRPAEVARCLAGLGEQVTSPSHVIVVARADDTETLAALARSSVGHRVISVKEPGQVHALAAGLKSVETEIVAFTDDDAVPRTDWISRMLEHFGDPSVGGVGGRDVIASDSSVELSNHVGTLGRWGRVVGNHHIGVGMPRRVDVLKGVNMAFRRHLVQLPIGLRGEGAQACNDLAVSLWVRRQGWQLIYDPDLIVDHYPAFRHSGTPRVRPPKAAISDEAYNQTAAILATKMVSPLRLGAYGLFFGDRAHPGPGRCLVGLGQGGAPELFRRATPALHGRLRAYLAYFGGDYLGYDLDVELGRGAGSRERRPNS